MQGQRKEGQTVTVLWAPGEPNRSTRSLGTRVWADTCALAQSHDVWARPSSMWPHGKLRSQRMT